VAEFPAPTRSAPPDTRSAWALLRIYLLIAVILVNVKIAQVALGG
jgi:hypothetical protein